MRRIYFFLFMIIFSMCAFAKEVDLYNFPKTLNWNNQELQLNGAGIRRKAGIFKVYAAALYTTTHVKTEEDAVTKSTSKAIKIKAIRSLDKETILDAFKQGFKKNCVICKGFDSQLGLLEKAISVNLSKGEELVIFFGADIVEIVIGGTPTKILGKDFPNDFIRVFIGKNPPDEKLKAGLLGGD